MSFGVKNVLSSGYLRGIFGGEVVRKNHATKVQKKIGICKLFGVLSSSIYHFPLKNLQPSAQNPFRAEDFCSIIIETRL